MVAWGKLRTTALESETITFQLGRAVPATRHKRAFYFLLSLTGFRLVRAHLRTYRSGFSAIVSAADSPRTSLHHALKSRLLCSPYSYILSYFFHSYPPKEFTTISSQYVPALSAIILTFIMLFQFTTF